MTLRYAPRAWALPFLVLGACIENTSPADNDKSSSPVVEVDAGKDAGKPVTDAGGDASDGDSAVDSGPPSVVEGSGKDCAGNSAAPAGGCYGFYCGTTAAAIRAETPETAACGTTRELEMICDGGISNEVTACARKAAVTSPDTFVAATSACVREKSEYDPISDACLTCYAQSADCARTKCLSECLPGDNPDCDKCREDNGCTPGFYACGGMPDPQ